MKKHWVLTLEGSQVATFPESFNRSIVHGKKRLISSPINGWADGGYELSLEDKPEPPSPKPVDPLSVKLSPNKFFKGLLQLDITEDDIQSTILALPDYSDVEKKKMLIDFNHPDGDGSFSFYHPLVGLLMTKKEISQKQAKAAWTAMVNS